MQSIAKWGYCFFTLSGSLFAINSLFGGTSGHARYVAAQLKLEEVIIRYGVKWSQYSAGADIAASAATAPAPVQAGAAVQSGDAGAPMKPADNPTGATGDTKAARGFELISEFLKEYTTVTSKETLQWAEEVVNDARNYASNTEKAVTAK